MAYKLNIAWPYHYKQQNCQSNLGTGRVAIRTDRSV